MSEDDLTVFDIKYNEAMKRLNSLYLPEEETTSNINSIKNYIEGYRLERSLEKRNSKMKENNKNKADDKRKQIVDLNEIRIHEKKTQQYYNKNYLKNEIEWYKIKQKEDEIKNRYNNNYNRQKYDNNISQKEISKEIIRNNKIKMIKFSNLANKVNIEKFKQQKKINKNSINNLLKDLNTDDINNKDNGKFIPYSKYKENEIVKNKNKRELINNRININMNRSGTINNNINKTIVNKNKINNHLSQNIINNKKEINKKSLEKKPLKSLDNKESINKRKLLNEKIDYLKEFEKRKQEPKIKIYENKNLLKNKNNGHNNIEILNFHSKNFEDKAKRQEQLMRIKGKSNNLNEDNVKLSNLLIDSISTKLAILNQMAS